MAAVQQLCDEMENSDEGAKYKWWREHVKKKEVKGAEATVRAMVDEVSTEKAMEWAMCDGNEEKENAVFRQFHGMTPKEAMQEEIDR